jgi:hypothetical protein
VQYPRGEPDLLLVTRGEYAPSLTSLWSRVENILNL